MAVPQVPQEKEAAKQLPKHLDDANRDLVQLNKQLNHVNERLPVLEQTVKEFPGDPDGVKQIAKSIDDEIKKLKEQIAVARDLADRIKVGMNFARTTTLELYNPPNLQELSTATYISGYFKTNASNGFLFYVGNGNGTNLRRTKTVSLFCN